MRFRAPRRGMMVVAAAGPAMNFALAWLTALALHALPETDSTTSGLLLDFAIPFILFNLLFGLFNLLPIPPLDGSLITLHTLEGVAGRLTGRRVRVPKMLFRSVAYGFTGIVLVALASAMVVDLAAPIDAFG